MHDAGMATKVEFRPLAAGNAGLCYTDPLGRGDTLTNLRQRNADTHKQRSEKDDTQEDTGRTTGITSQKTIQGGIDDRPACRYTKR